MKKVLLILSYIVIIGGMGFGIWYFWNQNRNQINQNAMLAQQNAQVQAQLSAIGEMTTVYEVSTKVYSGKPINESDLIAVSVPVSTLFTSSITDMSELLGRYYRVDINPGTILSRDMLMDESEDTPMKYTRELNFISLPVSTVVGDFIDIRFIIPNGEEYVVIAHKKIEHIYNNTTVTIKVSEEENAILNSLFQDLGNYNGSCLAYCMKYLEPGNDTDTVAYYPVQHDMENYIKFSPNIDDTTRCINPTLRDHIDEVMTLYTDSDNQVIAQSFISSLQSQYNAQLSAQTMWIQEHTDENGNLIIDGEPASTDGYEESFDQAVGEAYDSLEQSIEDLEAIQ